MLEETPPLFRLLAIQLIEASEKVVIKRGALRLEIEGAESLQFLQRLQHKISNKEVTISEIIAFFPENQRQIARRLIAYLKANHLLVHVNQFSSILDQQNDPIDTFYWHFGMDKSRISKQIETAALCVIGQNPLGTAIHNTMLESGIKNRSQLSSGFLPSIDLNENKINQNNIQALQNCQLMIATSAIGDVQRLLAFNQLAFEQKIPYLPVMLLDMQGVIGPLMIPGKTPCLACLLSPINAHVLHFEEEHYNADFKFHSPSSEAYHPSMLQTTAAISAFEINRYFLGIRGRIIGHLLQINLLDSTLNRQEIYRDPRCMVCSKT